MCIDVWAPFHMHKTCLRQWEIMLRIEGLLLMCRNLHRVDGRFRAKDDRGERILRERRAKQEAEKSNVYRTGNHVNCMCGI